MTTEFLAAILTGAAYVSGDPDAVVARYRIHFKPVLARADDYETLMSATTKAFISQGRDGILKWPKTIR